MAYDEDLADRIRVAIGNSEHATGQITEKRMFGGLAFLHDGTMGVAASGQGGLMLRVAPAQTAELIERPHAGPMVMRGKELAGWMRVDAAGVESDDDLQRWVDIGLSAASSLPPR
jgi:TfoX/Sxy family transcriptional regulator of competence genes